MAPHLLDVIPWTLLRGVPGGASTKGHISRGVVVVPQGQDVIPQRPHGGASCKGVIPRKPRGDAKLLGRNSTVSWWCLIERIQIVKSWCLIWFDASYVDVCHLFLNMRLYVECMI